MAYFEGRFRGTSREIPRRTLDSNLSSSREISGALNLALPALRKIRRETRYTETHSTREQWQEFVSVRESPGRASAEACPVRFEFGIKPELTPSCAAEARQSG